MRRKKIIMAREIFGPDYLPYKQEKQMQFQKFIRERVILSHSLFRTCQL
ncbi:MAG: hypothetical protein ACXAEF_09000 [Candidatus Thorarchaeota archaeon]